QGEMVILPGGGGHFGVMPNHVPTIAELKPGVVSVQEAAGGPLTKYFVSGGFASIGEDSKLAVSTLMAAPLEELDADAIKTGLAQYQAAYEKARRAPGLSRGPSRNLRGAASELSWNLRSRLGTSRDPPEPLPSPSDTRPRPARDPPETRPRPFPRRPTTWSSPRRRSASRSTRRCRTPSPRREQRRGVACVRGPGGV
ncbi:hypothetical protein EMIHUDRAFT_77818, partial [Emiliania huxleyi CCMP1516]|uniref:ATP synthase F1 complex delta/epsilon subunit N-terminal domain-containing protein n=2 Tax=Emiliania huxleyi TaxID=2903 RepID=A0A0D3KSF3_EMIH1